MLIEVPKGGRFRVLRLFFSIYLCHEPLKQSIMKKDQYIPHEISMRSTTEVMNLIEKEGMAGYGIYWAIMEYLRTQDDYTGDVRVLRTLARQLKTKLCKVESVLHNYGLFTLTDFTFRSIKLDAMMRPFRIRFMSTAISWWLIM